MVVNRGVAAREAMLDAAEDVVVERGLAAMALSEVQARAGQANKSAARYHFGSREGLITAVLDRRMAAVNIRRRELLDHHGPGPLTAAEVGLVLVGPLAAETVGRAASQYARFLMQALADPRQTSLVLEHLEAESFRELRRRHHEGTDLPEALAAIRFGSAVIHVVAALATWEAHGTEAVGGPEVVTADLVQTCTAVLGAPAGRVPPHAPPHETSTEWRS